MPHTIRIPYQSRAGVVFNITPSLVSDIERLVDQVTADIVQCKAADKFFAYLSVPISSRGGGHLGTNIEIAASTTQHLETLFGEKLWVLNPAAYNLPNEARGGDYMAVWADVLAGTDGVGGELDMVYFAGPADVWRFFGVKEVDRIGVINQWLSDRAAYDSEYKSLYDNPDSRSKFLKYYGIRGSSAYSKGAHDEWNIVTKFNRQRPIGADIAIYFDGSPIEPGDFGDEADLGYELLLH